MDYDLSYGGAGLGAFLPTMEETKASLMAGAVGGGGILVVSTVLGKIPQPESITDPMTWRRTKGLLAILTGIFGARAMYDRNPNASMAFLGGVAGMGMADLVASWVPAADDGSPMVRASLAGGHLSGADLRALSEAVTSATPAWGMAGTVAQTRALSAPVTSATELGQPAYQGFLS